MTKKKLMAKMPIGSEYFVKKIKFFYNQNTEQPTTYIRKKGFYD
jgi:hypothetical protein